MREDVDQKVDDATFEQGEVYSVDVAFSSGEGRFPMLCVCVSLFVPSVAICYYFFIACVLRLLLAT